MKNKKIKNKIKDRRKLERGCNFPHAMTSRKFTGSSFEYYYNW